MVVTLGQQYNIGEKPIVILYTYINRHAGTPEKQRKKQKQNKTWYIVIRGFAKKGYTPLFLRQKGAHLEND